MVWTRGSRAGYQLTDTRYIWEVAVADEPYSGCMARRRGKGKIKTESQVFGLNKAVNGTAIHRVRGTTENLVVHHVSGHCCYLHMLLFLGQ